MTGDDGLEWDALLAHAGFVRGLARALLCDAAIADDVAQETLLAAIRLPAIRRGRRPGDLRAWLSGVVKNLVRRSRRDAERRRRRESSFAREDTAPSASDAAARLDLIDHLVAAVRALDEPYRTAVLARYFESRTPQEIALQQGVPIETVRTRLKRAIERLRGALGPESEWSALLLPLAGLPPGVVVVAGLSTAAAGGAIGAIVMTAKSKLLVAAGLVAVLTTGALVWRQSHRPTSRAIAETDDPESASRVAARLVAGAPTVPRRTSDAASSATNEDPHATFVVRGYARSGKTKQPWPDAEVRAQFWRGYEMAGEPALEVTLHSEHDGAFAWRLDPPESTVWIRISSASPRCRRQSVERLVVGGDTAPDDLELTLYALDRTVTGRVLDAVGRPIADAHVAAFDPPTVDCDATGSFAIEMASSLEHQTLAAWAPGYAESRVEVRFGAPDRAPVRQDFRLEAGATLVGSVTDSVGAAIEGALVEEAFSRHSKARSAADGSYRLEHLAIGVDQIVEARATGHLLASKLVTLAPGENRNDFVLETGVRVRGTVLLPDGSPARGATLYIGFSRFASARLDAIAHDAGEFTFANVSRGEHRLVCERSGCAPLETQLKVPADVESVDGVLLRLSAAHFVAGRVVDEDGGPVEGALVRLLVGEEEFGGDRRSDSDGRFRLDGLPDARLEARIDRAGYVRTRKESIAVDQDGVRFVLKRAGRAAGHVVDGATGAPIAEFRLRFVGPVNAGGSIADYAWWNVGRAFHAQDGAWNTGDEQIEPGARMGIEASAEGYAPTLVDDVEFTVDPGRQDRRIELFRGGSMDGLVVDDRDRHPVAGALVKFVNDATPLMTGDRPTKTPRPTASTDDNGHFHLDGLPCGRATLYVDHPDYCGMPTGAFEVPASGAAPPQEVRLVRGAVVEALVLDGHGAPRPNARIMLSRSDRTGDWKNLSATTDAQGRFRVARLLAGRWQICVTEPSNGEWPQPVARFLELEPGAVETLTMPLGSSIVTGRIAREKDLPQQVIVEASRFDSDREGTNSLIERLQVVVDSDTYELAGLSPGPWTITARAFDRDRRVGWAAKSGITITEGGTNHLDLQLTINGR